MSDMDDLTEWLFGVFCELEEAARTAEDHMESPWLQHRHVVMSGDGSGSFDAEQRSVTEHVILHNPRAVLHRVRAEREIVRLHGPTRGRRDVIEPLDGWPLTQPSEDPADLAYPEAAKLCRVCGPGDSWQAKQEPFGELPCDTIRWIAYGHLYDADRYDRTWAPKGI